ncbi:DELTA-alicitoxin-Pse2b-like [Stylophora pistillata]|uniref:DELTA-alicitoxin-Pse2b-like n=1 Tax=Stylophora pistillata TaxID=50429 RepID=UPI000C0546DA|nr:DELTA-alicitoxin-Pse2b-like [Stylophora pistillata]
MWTLFGRQTVLSLRKKRDCTSKSRMMHVPLVFLILVLHAVRERCVATVAENYGLGRVIDLRKVNLLADFQEKENRIFEELPPKCLIKKTLKSSSSHFEYYANTKAFYESLATQSSLSASLQSSYSLGVTVSVATERKSSKNTEVSGMSLIKQALTEKIHVDKECLLSDNITLKGTFIKDFENLPVHIKNPWEPNSWREYRTFLNEYGSHAITSVKRGSRFQQMTFAESSKAYSQRDFQVKACVSAAGPTQVGMVGVSACSNVSQSEISKTSSMSTSEKRFVKGGKRETNSKLKTPKNISSDVADVLNASRFSKHFEFQLLEPGNPAPFDEVYIEAILFAFCASHKLAPGACCPKPTKPAEQENGCFPKSAKTDAGARYC